MCRLHDCTKCSISSFSSHFSALFICFSLLISVMKIRRKFVAPTRLEFGMRNRSRNYNILETYAIRSELNKNQFNFSAIFVFIFHFSFVFILYLSLSTGCVDKSLCKTMIIGLMGKFSDPI